MCHDTAEKSTRIPPGRSDVDGQRKNQPWASRVESSSQENGDSCLDRRRLVRRQPPICRPLPGYNRVQDSATCLGRFCPVSQLSLGTGVPICIRLGVAGDISTGCKEPVN